MDESLRRAMGATLRVGAGSGVVLSPEPDRVAIIATAAHVVKGVETVTVRWNSGSREVAIIQRNEELDVALVTAPVEVEGRGISLGDQAEVGEEGWLLGFGNGWDGNQALVTRGVASGVTNAGTWLDATGTWGHSGGPFVAMRAEGPVVLAVLRGNMSRVHQELRRRLKMANDNVQIIYDFLYVDKTIPFEEKLKHFPHLPNSFFSANEIASVFQIVELHFRAGFLECASGAHVRTIR